MAGTALQHREGVLTSACKNLIQLKEQFSRGAHSILATAKLKTQYINEKTMKAAMRIVRISE